MEYIRRICKIGNLKFAEDIDTFDKAKIFLNIFVPTFKKYLGQARSTDTFARVHLTIDAGLTMDDALKKLHISAATYRKYKNPDWLKNRPKIDWTAPSKEYVMQLKKLEMQSKQSA